MSVHVPRRVNGTALFTEQTGVMLGLREYGPATCWLSIAGGLPHAMQSMSREVTNVFVPPADRRAGAASGLMWHVCQEADVNGLALMLSVARYGGDMPPDDAPDESTLERWYAGFGFEAVQRLPILLMIRRVRAVMH